MSDIHGKSVQGDPSKRLEVFALRHRPEPSALPLWKPQNSLSNNYLSVSL